MNNSLRTFWQVIATLTDTLSVYACKTKVHARDIWTVEAGVDTGSIPGVTYWPTRPLQDETGAAGGPSVKMLSRSQAKQAGREKY